MRTGNLLKRFIGRIQILFTVTGIVRANRSAAKKGPVYNYAKIGQEIVKILGM
jgi:hypothetical protein